MLGSGLPGNEFKRLSDKIRVRICEIETELRGPLRSWGRGALLPRSRKWLGRFDGVARISSKLMSCNGQRALRWLLQVQRQRSGVRTIIRCVTKAPPCSRCGSPRGAEATAVHQLQLEEDAPSRRSRRAPDSSAQCRHTPRGYCWGLPPHLTAPRHT